MAWKTPPTGLDGHCCQCRQLDLEAALGELSARDQFSFQTMMSNELAIHSFSSSLDALGIDHQRVHLAYLSGLAWHGCHGQAGGVDPCRVGLTRRRHGPQPADQVARLAWLCWGAPCDRAPQGSFRPAPPFAGWVPTTRRETRAASRNGVPSNQHGEPLAVIVIGAVVLDSGPLRVHKPQELPERCVRSDRAVIARSVSGSTRHAVK